MKEFLLLFWNKSGNGQYLIDPENMKNEMEAWQSWIGNIAMQGKLVSTKPINWNGVQVSNKGQKNNPFIADELLVTGFLICKSQSVQEVEQWAKSCPILQYPQGMTEIRECQPFEI